MTHRNARARRNIAELAFSPALLPKSYPHFVISPATTNGSLLERTFSAMSVFPGGVFPSSEAQKLRTSLAPRHSSRLTTSEWYENAHRATVGFCRGSARLLLLFVGLEPPADSSFGSLLTTSPSSKTSSSSPSSTTKATDRTQCLCAMNFRLPSVLSHAAAHLVTGVSSSPVPNSHASQSTRSRTLLLLRDHTWHWKGAKRAARLASALGTFRPVSVPSPFGALIVTVIFSSGGRKISSPNEVPIVRAIRAYSMCVVGVRVRSFRGSAISACTKPPVPFFGKSDTAKPFTRASNPRVVCANRSDPPSPHALATALYPKIRPPRVL
mmetsp:Transcript_12247/g.45592  ORF Transcript_12247/g.45592 Transcript_12247/m.45592 type:complete len:325 (-) Transcript_12247:254-1228(-)